MKIWAIKLFSILASYAIISDSVAFVADSKTSRVMLYINSFVDTIGSTPYRTYSKTFVPLFNYLSTVLYLFLVLNATGLVSMSKDTIECINNEYFMKSIANSGIVLVRVVDFL